MCRYYEIIKYHLDILFIYPNWHPYRHSFHPLSPKRWAYIIKTQKKKSFAIAFKTSAKLFGARNRTSSIIRYYFLLVDIVRFTFFEILLKWSP